MRLAGLLFAAQTAAYLVFLAAGTPTLNIDSDTGVFTYVSATVTLAVAVLAARRGMRWVGVAVAVLAVDDLLAIHERVNPHIGPFPTWPIIFLPLLAYVLVGLWRYPRTRPGLMLLLAAVALEMLTAVVFAIADNGGTLYRGEVILEEGAELAGWTLIATVLASAWEWMAARKIAALVGFAAAGVYVVWFSAMVALYVPA